MEPNNKCDCKCNCSQMSLDMTLRECFEKMGVDPEKAQNFIANCCKNCCSKE